MNNNIVKIDNKGYIYEVYGKDAYVVSYIMRYKLVSNSNGYVKCGFSNDQLNDVIRFLEKNYVSYEVVGDYKKRKLFNNNRYDNFIRDDSFVSYKSDIPKNYSGDFTIKFEDDDEVSEFLIGLNISSDTEIVKKVYENNIGDIVTLDSGEKFRIIKNNISYK